MPLIKLCLGELIAFGNHQRAREEAEKRLEKGSDLADEQRAILLIYIGLTFYHDQ